MTNSAILGDLPPVLQLIILVAIPPVVVGLSAYAAKPGNIDTGSNVVHGSTSVQGSSEAILPSATDDGAFRSSEQEHVDPKDRWV